jgi:uncharacterized protein
MRIVEASQKECRELLRRASLGRLGCSLQDQPYVVPVGFAYESDCLYVFSTAGKKIEWMRQNSKVCLQVDEVADRSSWLSVIVNGTYRELVEPRYTDERERARKHLAQAEQWWKVPLAERREQTSDVSIETVFFSIDIQSMTGLRATAEG